MVQGGAGADKLYTRGFKNLFGIYTVATEYMDDTLKMLRNKTPKPNTVAIVYSNDLFFQLRLLKGHGHLHKNTDIK